MNKNVEFYEIYSVKNCFAFHFVHVFSCLFLIIILDSLLQNICLDYSHSPIVRYDMMRIKILEIIANIIKSI